MQELLCEKSDYLDAGDRIKTTSGDSTLYHKLVKKDWHYMTNMIWTLTEILDLRFPCGKRNENFLNICS